jgi:hypothetical protein
MPQKLAVDFQFPFIRAEDVVDVSYGKSIVRSDRPNPAVYFPLIEHRHFNTIRIKGYHNYMLLTLT